MILVIGCAFILYLVVCTDPVHAPTFEAFS